MIDSVWILALASVLILPGAAAAQAVSSESAEPPKTYALADVEIELDASRCHLSCSHYVIRLTGTGEVRFDGIEGTEVSGQRTSRLDPEAFVSLANEFYSSDFFHYRPEYRVRRFIEVDSAGTVTESNVYRTHQVTRVVTFRVGDYEKTVSGYDAFPEAFSRLVERIIELSGAEEWIGDLPR